MNMSRNQLVMAAIGVVAVIGAAVLAYLAFDAYSGKGEAADELESARGRIQRILRADIAANGASVSAINKNCAAISGWSEAAMSTAAAGDRAVASDTNDAAFKQKLVNEARELSNLPGGVDGKIVKDDFPFGFQDLVVGDKMPDKDKLPRLQRQWGDIGQIVRILADCGVVELVRIEAVTPAPREQKPENPVRGKKPAKKKAGAEEEKPLYTVESYAVDFRAKPAALVKVVNSLASAARFFTVDSLSFAREGDMIATALGEGEKKQADQPATGRRRRRRAADPAAEQAEADAQAAENANKGVANDPALEAPFMVKAVVSTFDFGTAAPLDAASEAESASESEDKEEEE